MLLRSVYLDEFMKNPVSGISQAELINDLIEKKFDFLKLSEATEIYSISSDIVVREKSLRIQVEFLKKNVETDELDIFNEFLIAKLHDRYNIQPIAIEGLLYSFIKKPPKIDILMKLIDETLITKLNINSMAEEKISQFYILIEKIINICDLNIFATKLINIIHVTLKNQFNFDIAISAIILIKLLKLNCNQLSIPLNLTPDIFNYFKMHFPINTGLHGQNFSALELTKIFINTLSLFKNVHLDTLSLALDNISSSLVYTRADCFALVHSVFANISENDSLLLVDQSHAFYNISCSVISFTFQPFIENISISLNDLKQSDQSVRLAVLKQISITLYNIQMQHQFRAHFEDKISQLRFNMTHESLLAIAEFYEVLYILECPTLNLLFRNLVNYLENPPAHSTEHYNQLFVRIHDFFTFTDDQILKLTPHLLTIEISNDSLNILITTYPRHFNYLYMEKLVFDTTTLIPINLDRIKKILVSGPPSITEKIMTEIVFEKFNDKRLSKTDTIILAEIINSVLKFKNLVSYVFVKFSAFLQDNIKNYQIIDVPSFYMTLSSILNLFYSHFKESTPEFDVYRRTPITSNYPQNSLFSSEIPASILCLIARKLCADNNYYHEVLLELFVNYCLHDKSCNFSRFLLQTVYEFSINSTVSSDYIRSLINIIFKDDVINIKIILSLIKARLVKSLSLKTCFSDSVDLVTTKLIYFNNWSGDFLKDLLISERDKPTLISESSWNIFLQNISLKYLLLFRDALRLSSDIFCVSDYSLFFYLVEKLMSYLLPTNIPLNFSQIFNFICTYMKGSAELECSCEIFLRNMLMNSTNISKESGTLIVDTILYSLSNMKYRKTFKPIYLIQSLRIIGPHLDSYFNAIKIKVTKELKFYINSPKRIIRTEAMRCLNEIMQINTD
ncbi:hypothetical protein HZS_6445 [Henneguya salminicola]|nr:hypothetical protein HZS_6445 [Henneguya salminicola]